MKSIRLLMVFAIATFGLAVSSEAGSVTCPGGGATRSFTLVIPGAPTATCGPSGNGPNDVNGDSDDFFTPEWEAWDKDPETASSETLITDGWLTVSGIDSGSGSLTLSAAVWGAYGEVLLAFKVGGGGPTLFPDWASFIIPTGWFGTATWSISSQALSHLTAYGRGEPSLTQVPEPAALLLFGTGLAATAVAIRRRRRTA